MKAHWTTGNDKAFLFKIVDDFIMQIEKKMEALNISQGKLAKKLRVSKGRVSQVMSNPGNVSLLTVIKYSRSLGMKVALIAYEDNDPKNIKGPINSEVFMSCWEKCYKPRDLWDMKSLQANQAPSVLLSAMDQCWDLLKPSQPDWVVKDFGTSAVPDPETFIKAPKAATGMQREAEIV
jgi:transcriptional regulator with XRE-family HTH domain